MASKANMLKQAANKTGKGLFAGMSRLDEREEGTSNEVAVTNDIVKEQESTKEVNKVKADPIQNKVVESPAEEPVYEAPVIQQSEPQAPVIEQSQAQTEIINEKINKPEKTDKIDASSKSTSRYEKEKFLLLDIRGYRDYVEHMAKAANMSATKYIRNLIQQDMDKNNDIYLAHKALEEKLRGRSGN